jgi:hypothetical protein
VLSVTILTICLRFQSPASAPAASLGAQAKAPWGMRMGEGAFLGWRRPEGLFHRGDVVIVRLPSIDQLYLKMRVCLPN